MEAFGNLFERRTGPSWEPALGERVVWDESDPGGRADIDQAVGRAVPQIVAVLDRHDLGHPLCARQLGRRNVRYADVADLALALKVDKGADRILDRHAMIDGVKLVELDPVEPQSPQAVGADAPQVFRPGVDDPAAWAGPREPAFARDHQPCRIRVQGLGDQRLADSRPVGIGGVDKGHSLFDGSAKQCDRFPLVAGKSPNARAGNAHRTKSETANRRASLERQRQINRSALVWHDEARAAATRRVAGNKVADSSSRAGSSRMGRSRP